MLRLWNVLICSPSGCYAADFQDGVSLLLVRTWYAGAEQLLGYCTVCALVLCYYMRTLLPYMRTQYVILVCGYALLGGALIASHGMHT